MELLEHQSVGQYAVLDVVFSGRLLHEVSVHMRSERITVGTYVYLYGVFVVVQPFVYFVRESYAQVICRTLLVEDHALSTTRTPQVATVIDGESEMLYVSRPVV